MGKKRSLVSNGGGNDASSPIVINTSTTVVETVEGGGEKTVMDVTKQSNIHTLRELDSFLLKQFLNDDARKKFLFVVAKAIGADNGDVPSTHLSETIALHHPIPSSATSSTVTTPQTSARLAANQMKAKMFSSMINPVIQSAPPPPPTSSATGHNEICEVCNTGNLSSSEQLLHCLTCTLSFHQHCLRPKQMNNNTSTTNNNNDNSSAVGDMNNDSASTTAPTIATTDSNNNSNKGPRKDFVSVNNIEKFHCVHCIIDGAVPGDVLAAKDSLDKMHRLTKRLQQKQQLQLQLQQQQQLLQQQQLFAITNGRAGVDVSKENGDEFQVALKRNGMFFHLINAKYNEIGKFSTVEAAFSYVKKVLRTTSSSGSGNNGSSSSNNNNSNSLPISGLEHISIRCTACLDSSDGSSRELLEGNAIPFCCFCGCRDCFGTLDATKMRSCDGCQSRFHLHCGTESSGSNNNSSNNNDNSEYSNSIVDDEAWFCKFCVSSEVADGSNTKKKARTSKEASVANDTFVWPSPEAGSQGVVEDATGTTSTSTTTATTAMPVLSVRSLQQVIESLTPESSSTTLPLLLKMLKSYRCWAPNKDLDIVLHALTQKINTLREQSTIETKVPTTMPVSLSLST